MTTGCRPVQRIVGTYEQDALVLGIPDDGAVRALEGYVAVAAGHTAVGIVDGDASEYGVLNDCAKITCLFLLFTPLNNKWCAGRDGGWCCVEVQRQR